MCWSTKPRTQTLRNGKSSTAGRGIFLGSSESESAIVPCSWSATSNSRFTASRGPIRARFHPGPGGFSGARAELLGFGDDLFSHRQRAREFRDLSIAASFRSAQPVLDVVDAVIGTVGHAALALAEPPPAHRAHQRRAPRLRSSCGHPSPFPKSPRTIRRGRGALGFPARPLLRREPSPIGSAGCSMRRPSCSSTGRVAEVPAISSSWSAAAASWPR